MIRIKNHPSRVNNYTMPNHTQSVFPGLRENGAEHDSPPIVNKTSDVDQSVIQHNVHLPQIRNDTPNNLKSDRKHSRFFKFASDRNSFTENLLSFFTGNKDRGHDKHNNAAIVSRKIGATNAKENGMRNSRAETRRGMSTKNDRGSRGHLNQSTSQKQPLRRTDKTRITAVTKSDSFRPATGGTHARTSNGHIANNDDESDVGGYENMYKIKQPVGKFNVPRKRSLEINEYIRRENYKYNERTAKQFLFQKWLKSTEMELPERYPVEHNDTIMSK